MKRHVKRSLLALLVLALVLVPVLALSASAEYAETAEWMNTNPNAPTDYAFSLAVIGDTQILVEEDANSRADDDPSNDTNYTASIYNWIVANAEAKKMQYVLGLGDITNGNTDAEWEVAKEAIGEPKNLEEQALKLAGRDIYEKLVKGSHYHNEWRCPLHPCKGCTSS